MSEMDARKLATLKDLSNTVNIILNFHVLELTVYWNLSYAPIPEFRDISCCEACYV